jgi:chitinase
MPSEDFTVENYWSLGTTPLWHDYSCYSRWGDTQPLTKAEIDGKPGWRPLFTMNQFHGVPLRSHAAKDNTFDALRERYRDYCQPVAKRKPNFVAVDFHEVGDVHDFVEWLQAQPEELGP